MKRYYPVYLDIEGRKCVVVGGGTVAARKAKSLTDAGAEVKLVSPKFCRPLLDQAKKGRVRLSRKRFEARDLDGAFLAIACSNDRKVNDRVHEAAKRRGALVNVVDSPEQCDFIVPSVVSRGALTIAISTSAVSPALARRIREELEKRYGSNYATFLALMEKSRPKILGKVKKQPERKKIFEALTRPRFVSEFVSKAKREAEALFREKLKQLLSSGEGDHV